MKKLSDILDISPIKLPVNKEQRSHLISVKAAILAL